jgi:NAD(P)-dependent dehydrogenase (short-subunit alcohol dehydrogenase family)
VAAKSTSDAYATKPFPPNPNSQASTISTVEREIREAGGQATAVEVDVRDVESVKRLVDKTVEVNASLFRVIMYFGTLTDLTKFLEEI